MAYIVYRSTQAVSPQAHIRPPSAPPRQRATDSRSAPSRVSPSLVSDAPIYPQSVDTIDAVVGASWTGTLATFTDDDPYATPSDYTVTVNYGDNTADASATVSSDGNGGFIVTGSHQFSLASSYLNIVINDYGGSSASATDFSQTSPAPIYLSASSIQLQEPDPTPTVIANLTDTAGVYANGSYSGTVTLDGDTSQTYQLTFVPSAGGGSGVYDVEASSIPILSAGDHSAVLTASGYVNGQTTDATPVTFSIDVAAAPITAAAQNISLYAAVPWTGTVATFTDADPNAQASDYTATIAYAGGTTSRRHHLLRQQRWILRHRRTDLRHPRKLRAHCHHLRL